MSTSEEVVHKDKEEGKDEARENDKDVDEGLELKTKLIEQNKITAKYEELVEVSKKEHEQMKGLYRTTCRRFVEDAFEELIKNDISVEIARKIVTYDACVVCGWAYKSVNDVMPKEAKNEKMAELGRHGAEIKKLKRGLGSENMDKGKIKEIASLGGKGKAESFHSKVKNAVDEIANLTEEISNKEVEIERSEFEYVLEVETEVLERILNKAKQADSNIIKFVLKDIDGHLFAIKDYQLSEPKRTEMI